jgi:prepilin-type N-terminal cleavage/methylation domain-containing protein
MLVRVLEVFVRKEIIMRKLQGFTLLELLIVVVILGVLALIAAPTLLNAADKAKEGAVKANVSAAASTVTTRLAVNEEDGAVAAATATDNLNGTDTSDAADDSKSPFNTTVNAFVAADAGSKGQVSLDGAADTYQVTIKGWGKDGTTAIAAKTVKAPQAAASSGT